MGREKLATVWGGIVGWIYRHIIVVLTCMLLAGVALIFWSTHRVFQRLVSAVATQDVSQQAELVAGLRTLYMSEVVSRLRAHGVEARGDYEGKERAIPLPETLTAALGRKLGERQPGFQIRLYNDPPFPSRQDGGPRDEFEREALRLLRARPAQEVARFERAEGRTVLRYARAEVARAECVSCHNSHAGSPKRDWREGDLMGVLEIIRPLNPVVTQVRSELSETFALIGGMTGLGLLALGLVMGRLRRTSADLEQRVAERTVELERAKVAAQTEMESHRRTEQQFHDLVESAPDAIVIVNREGRIVLVNAETGRLFGYPRVELLGQPVETLIPGRFHDRHVHERQGYTHHPARRPMGSGLELFGRRKDGSEFPAEISLSPLETAQGRLITAVIRDVTERRKAKEELERHVAEVERFTYVASHHLQEPLRMVASFVELLRHRYRDRLDADADEFIKFAVEGTVRMKALLQDLHAYANLFRRPARLGPTDCEAVLKTVLGRMQTGIAASGANITHDPLPTVTADAALLTQLFENLLGNALKFCRKEAPQIHVGARREGGAWRFSVQDNGLGIEPQYFERIFRVFERLHRHEDYPGTGVGLATCKRIVEHHGGRIWVEAELGRGSTFHFTIPDAAAAAKP
ncbi:MAG: PAS domain S-box protein [Verrucomicrobia bacterium]|nr:PAS domain S-box protein [Verrucomicrobiota bacterium]